MKNQIRALREEAGLKQVDLAAALGVRQNTLSTWETGRYEPDNEMLQKIADYFSVSVDYVLGKTSVRNIKLPQVTTTQVMNLLRTIEEMNPAQYEQTYEFANDLLSGQNYSNSGGIRIPVLGSIPAGIPLEAIEEIIDWEEIPESMCAGGKEYFALEVKGDSMWPDYLPGDVVIVRKTPCFESGDVCVVYVNGYDATLKQVKSLDDGSMTLVPRNQSYPPRTYSKEEVMALPISIAGVVVELRRKIKGGKP